MRNKDIMLSASLIAIYLVTQLLGSTIPINISSMMISALFGLFWYYLPVKTNLFFILLRFGWNAVGSIRYLPKILNYMKLESVMGLQFLEWFGARATESWQRGYDLLTATANLEPTFTFYVVVYGYMLGLALITPYLFYRYFKRVGVFRRMPAF